MYEVMKYIGKRLKTKESFECNYVNHRGQWSQRVITPHLLWFGTTEHHPTPQWLLDGIDPAKVDRKTKDDGHRTFAVSEIGIRPEELSR